MLHRRIALMCLPACLHTCPQGAASGEVVLTAAELASAKERISGLEDELAQADKYGASLKRQLERLKQVGGPDRGSRRDGGVT